VRTLYGDPRVDIAARELRGLTAVELAKDDEVRNRIDDLTLFTQMPSMDQRTTGVVRAYLVEDATVRFVVKSGAPVDEQSFAVTTCRRSLGDFEHLSRLLQMENPASWIPSIAAEPGGAAGFAGQDGLVFAGAAAAPDVCDARDAVGVLFGAGPAARHDGGA
jgi:hypothetical protein